MFYYEEGYPMHVGQAAKRLLEARDAYAEAWIEWNSTCLGAGDVDDEISAMEGILNKASKSHKADHSAKMIRHEPQRQTHNPPDQTLRPPLLGGMTISTPIAHPRTKCKLFA